jgi:hypothetical protein
MISNMSKKARKSKAKKKSKPKRQPKPDFSQIALANVEKIIGCKLSDGMKLKRK